MAFKHQTQSYRTRHGIRFVCDGDVATLAEARSRLAELRSEGFEAFYETHDAGAYRRVFVEARRYPATPSLTPESV